MHKESELSKIAKSLSNEGTYGLSLDKKVDALIKERDFYKEQLEIQKNEIKTFFEFCSDVKNQICELESWHCQGYVKR